MPDRRPPRLVDAAVRHLVAVGRLARRGFSPEVAAVIRAEWRWYVDHIDPGMTVFDVGANAGLTSVFFAQLAGAAGAVWAFEPGSAAYRRLRQTIAAQQATNVTPVKAAVAARDGRARLHVYEPSSDTKNSLYRRPPATVLRTPIGSEQVKTISLDRFCRQHRIDRIDLLKIDTEGAELEVLRGCHALLAAQHIACCLFEIGQTCFDAGTTPRAIFDYLADHGYRVAPLLGPRLLLKREYTSDTVPFMMVTAEPR